MSIKFSLHQGLLAELFAHQQVKTDYITFNKMCAETGIEKWKICMVKMTCTYFDKAGNEILVEQIRQSIHPVTLSLMLFGDSFAVFILTNIVK